MPLDPAYFLRMAALSASRLIKLRNMSRPSLGIPVALFCLCLAAAPVGTAGTFRAAAAKVSVTPNNAQVLAGYTPRVSSHVHDQIYHRLLLLDDGVNALLLISSDFSSINCDYRDRIAARIEGEFGIPVSNIWWSVTHTHSAPDFGPPHSLSAVLHGAAGRNRSPVPSDPEYTAMVEQKLFEGVQLVKQHLEPAALAVGWGFSQANINRRARDTQNRITLGMDPDAAVDRRIGLLRIDRADGTPLALVANYAMHGTVMSSRSTAISGDAPGAVAQYVEDAIGAPMLYINGAAGNLAPLYSQRDCPAEGHLDQFCVLLGNRILEANKAMSSSTNRVKLHLTTLAVTTPRKEGLGWPDDLANYTKMDAQGRPQVVIPIKCLRINHDTVIWSAPLELFCEISNEIRNLSPFEHTFYFGYADGWLGYLLTESEMNLGGYEATTSPFSGRAALDLTERVLTHLKELPRNP